MYIVVYNILGVKVFENLNFTTDVNFPWEIGLNATDVECYKLPMIIDVSITIHLIDDVSDTTSGKAMYDFDVTNVIKRSTNPAIIPVPAPPPSIPTTTVTSSPKKKILPAATIPTLFFVFCCLLTLDAASLDTPKSYMSATGAVGVWGLGFRV